jgi:hypothetical protein
VASFAIFPYGRVHDTSTDAVWSAIFGANWHFQALGTNYFSQSQPPSPLQH